MPTITTTKIPFSSPDIIRPGAGAEQWHNGSARISYPTASQPQSVENSLDVYYRFSWTQVEGSTQGSYTWTYFDNLVRSAINKGQKLSFGIMSHRGETDGDGRVSYGGGVAYYPQYLHNLMQGESSNSRDWLSNGIWVPNFNSPNYIARLRALHEAVKNRLLTTSYTPSSGPNAGKSVLFADAIYCIDIRGFGTWGEWHTSSGMSQWNAFPSGRVPTSSALKQIIDAHTQIFDRWPLVMMIAGYNGSSATSLNVFHPYPDVAYYAITAKNAWGDVGFRKDQWGAQDAYLANLAENNNTTYNGSPQFKNLIMDKWKTAPVTGEPMPGQAPADGMVDLVRQIKLYHATSFGNGNWPDPNSLDNATKDRIREAFKSAGYRLVIEGGSVEASNGSLNLTLEWKNEGTAPTYEDWNVAVYLKNSNGNIAWQSLSKFKPKLFIPQPTSTTVADTFSLGNLAAGTYTVAVRVVDPKNYRQPMPLFIEGVQSDGSYHLATVTVGSTPPPPPPNQAPTVSASDDVTITLPVNSVTLSSQATDGDGSIVAYQWTKVSGSGNIATPSSPSTVIASLTEGTSVFRITVTDNQGATASDTVMVTVKPEVIISPPPAPTVKSVTTKVEVTTKTTYTITFSDGTQQVITETKIS